VAPKATNKWVTLWELNKMRRNEPEKINSLWYDQFLLNCYTFNLQAGPPGVLLSLLLDKKWAVRAVLCTLMAVATAVLGKQVHFVVVRLLTSTFFWKQHLNWSRIVYAPLPAKLYFLSIIWRAVVVKYFLLFEEVVRQYLIEMECELLEYSCPSEAEVPEDCVGG